MQAARATGVRALPVLAAHLVHAPRAGLRERADLLRHFRRGGEQLLRPAGRNAVDEPERERLRRREPVALKRDLAKRLRVRGFSLEDGHKACRDLGTEVNLPGKGSTWLRGKVVVWPARETCRTDLVHAHPGVSLAAVDHDAVVTRKSEAHSARERVPIHDRNDRDCGP